jgi:hypothetical protein
MIYLLHVNTKAGGYIRSINLGGVLFHIYRERNKSQNGKGRKQL